MGKNDRLWHLVDNHSELFHCIVQEFETEEIEMVMAVTWALWRSRNLKVWEGKLKTPTLVLNFASTIVNEWKTARIPAVPINVARPCVRHMPKSRYLKINVDVIFLY